MLWPPESTWLPFEPEFRRKSMHKVNLASWYSMFKKQQETFLPKIIWLKGQCFQQWFYKGRSMYFPDWDYSQALLSYMNYVPWIRFLVLRQVQVDWWVHSWDRRTLKAKLLSEKVLKVREQEHFMALSDNWKGCVAEKRALSYRAQHHQSLERSHCNREAIKWKERELS